MTDEKRLAMLKWREGIVDLVLDTDAATEVDDPFAIAYLLLSPERFRLQAIYAAPFAMNERTQDPAEGMEMSYEEILHIMRLCHKDQVCPVYRGAKKWLIEKTEEEMAQIRSGRVWSDLRLQRISSGDQKIYIRESFIRAWHWGGDESCISTFEGSVDRRANRDYLAGRR